METKEITSLNNPIVKEVFKLQQKKYRNEFILLEGKKSIDEALSLGLSVKYIFSQIKIENYPCKNFLVSESVMKKISTTTSPANIVGVFKKPNYKLESFKKFKRIVLLDSIKDQGNLGTVIRASCAFGVDGILLFGDTTDEFSPKTIRSAAGNMFKIPILKVEFEEFKTFKTNFKLYATTVNSSNSINNIQLDKQSILMFGSEANGLSKELLELADKNITIKMANNVESLNLALSVGIILYEFYNK